MLDNWQDDLKSSLRERGNFVHGSREVENKVDKESSISDAERLSLNSTGSRSLMLHTEGEDTFPERAYVLANEELDKPREGKENRRECDNDVIFEGPSPAIEEDEGMVDRSESGRADFMAYGVERDLLLTRETHLIAPDQRKVCGTVHSGEDNKVARKVVGSRDREDRKAGDRLYCLYQAE